MNHGPLRKCLWPMRTLPCPRYSQDSELRPPESWEHCQQDFYWVTGIFPADHMHTRLLEGQKNKHNHVHTYFKHRCNTKAPMTSHNCCTLHDFTRLLDGSENATLLRLNSLVGASGFQIYKQISLEFKAQAWAGNSNRRPDPHQKPIKFVNSSEIDIENGFCDCESIYIFPIVELDGGEGVGCAMQWRSPTEPPWKMHSQLCGHFEIYVDFCAAPQSCRKICQYNVQR